MSLPQEWDEWLSELIPQLERRIECQLGSYLRDRLDASDIVQDAALRLIRIQEPLRINSKKALRALLWRIARNCLCDLADYHSTSRRSVRREERWSRRTELRQLPKTGPLAQLTAAEAKARLELALELLSERDRAVVELRSDGLTWVDIGKQLELRTDATRMRYVRAMGRLTHIFLSLDLSGYREP